MGCQRDQYLRVGVEPRDRRIAARAITSRRVTSASRQQERTLAERRPSIPAPASPDRHAHGNGHRPGGHLLMVADRPVSRPGRQCAEDYRGNLPLRAFSVMSGNSAAPPSPSQPARRRRDCSVGFAANTSTASVSHRLTVAPIQQQRRGLVHRCTGDAGRGSQSAIATRHAVGRRRLLFAALPVLPQA